MKNLDKTNKYSGSKINIKKIGLKGLLIFGELGLGATSLGCATSEAIIDEPITTLEQSIHTPTPTATPEVTPTLVPTATPEPELSREEELELLGFKEGPEIHNNIAVTLLRYEINDEIKMLFTYFEVDYSTNEIVHYDCFNDIELARIPLVEGRLYTPKAMAEEMSATNPALEGAEFLGMEVLCSVDYKQHDFPEVKPYNTKHQEIFEVSEEGREFPRKILAEIYLDIVPKPNRVYKKDLTPQEKEDTKQSSARAKIRKPVSI